MSAYRGLLALAALAAALLGSLDPTPAGEPARKKVAAIVTVYYHNSHADMLVSRMLQTSTLDGQGRVPQIELASLYTDQVPQNDISRRLSAEHRFPIYPTVADALCLGTGKLAVDGVLLVAEHGEYPLSPLGQIQYPKRRLFEQIVEVFRQSGRAVPVFVDKHLADTWEDARWMYDTAKRLEFPLLAGSSVPLTYRRPPADVDQRGKLEEIVVVSYHTLDCYGFHALEAAQALAEQRRGGEAGIRAVRTLVDQAVWQAGEEGVYDRKLLAAALERLERPVPADKPLSELVEHPVLFVIDYADGLRVNVLTLNYVVGEWAAAWRYADGQAESTLFWTQEARPFIHFHYQFLGIEELMLTGKPAWPVERTLLTSGVLDSLLVSKRDGGRWLETPQLQIPYAAGWKWREPPPPPPDRPINGQ